MTSELILIDAGHGGIVQGEYVTPGKRYYRSDRQLAEGAYNRAVAHSLAASLHLLSIRCHIINPEHEDISLKARARRVNQIARTEECILLSIHHNYFRDESVSGAEFFTSMGDTAADDIAEMMGQSFSIRYPYERLRRSTINPGQWSKDAGYYILRSTVCPAILSEWAFMSNESDRERIINGVAEQVAFFTHFFKHIL